MRPSGPAGRETETEMDGAVHRVGWIVRGMCVCVAVHIHTVHDWFSAGFLFLH
jgi:hypothetical protein